MIPTRAVAVVVPEGIDDPLRPSGGNTYDRRVCDTLAGCGWQLRTRAVAGDWPGADEAAHARLDRALDALDDDSVVLVDGLLASAAPEVMVPAASRLRLVVLLHMPLGLREDRLHARGCERAVLRAARAVVTTSEWSREAVLTAYDLDPHRVHAACPGVDVAEPTAGRSGGGRLLCVGAVTPGKGHDVLLAALARVVDQPWRCTCVGSVTRDREFVARLRRRADDAGLEDRVVLTGPRTGDDLHHAYASADALILASRAETYGMVVTEALARGVPVLASDTGGVTEALGTTANGVRPGLLTPPGDVEALAEALRRWLTRPGLRRELRAAARERRTTLTGWHETADRVGRVLQEAAR